MTDFIFLYPKWLLGLLLIPVFIGWQYRRHQSDTSTNNQQTNALIAPHLAKKLGLEKSSYWRSICYFFSFAWSIAIIALAGPSMQQVKLPSFDVSTPRVLVLDMSTSMYATDIKPNRLTQARYKALDLLPHWQEGSTGLVAYAGDAYTISPLTSDTQTLANLIPNLSPEIMPIQGGNAPAGIQLAIEMLTQAGHLKGDIVLISDELDDSELSQALKLVKSTHWKVSILGAGTRNGAPIQQPNGALLKQSSGQTVIARMNTSNMQTLASQTGGVFTPLQATNADIDYIAGATTSSLNNPMQDNNKEQDIQLLDRVNNGFWLLPLLLIPALFLFRRGIFWLATLTLLPLMHTSDVHASPWKNSQQQGYDAFQHSDYSQASELFTDLKWKGAAQYQAGDYQGAIESLSQVDGEDAQYNLANAYAQDGQFEKAIELYEDILSQNPDNQDAQENLAKVKQAQQQQEQQESDQQSSDDNSPSSDKQDSQDQNAESDQSPSPSDQDDSSNNDGEQTNDSNSTEPEPSSDPEQSAPEATSDQEQDSPSQDQDEQTDQQGEPAETDSQEQDTDANQSQTESISTTNEQASDPDMRRLEQVESVRDPSQLIRAQMLLQAQQKSAPDNNGKTW
ncbi:hypothetical protein BCU68_04010 [Vibrio sp. 10N.286.49.B3]|uniref:VWA domain-containing protein n=1 Tax=Vibrio sp. 10N.286.49.B3 TaxID=1880855 RepID=UPI000C857777|nr:VWA domain-containing protein [Vibrio sp. 10N.286.49.B3]PMH43161.1 hypothetical protein BCU68_04010 [Vibrio sp. 10N.286.49.B3]